MPEPIDPQHDMPASARTNTESGQIPRRPERGSSHRADITRPPMSPPEQVLALGPARDAHGLDAHRLMAIRERYARGVYDSPDVLEMVACRLLARGEV